jgi:ABC-type branched-subunit amino acid transport system permease subunit
VRRALAKAGRTAVLFGVPLVVVAFLGSAFASPANERVIVNFFITLVLALSIQTFTGNSGIVSFGHVGFMGVGGGLWAEYNVAFGPRQFFFSLTFALLAVLVVGGLGSVSGAVIGAVIVTAASEIMRRLEDRTGIGGLANMAVALMILLVLYRRPDGLLGRVELDDLLGRRLGRWRPGTRHEAH